ncbi:hypothetical protein BVRB_5g099780 isoform B [Beta vulgaris subsp. vulgaris]|nr:hypothetical protein BVRB_5g099780 isoform B [Beta vulgaris subsp. vulgaris]
MSIISGAVKQTPAPGNDGVSRKSQIELSLEVNACRVLMVAEQLTMCAQASDQHEKFHHLCLALSSELDNVVDEALQHNQDYPGGNCQHVLRGIDYGLANNEVPSHASKLPPVLKMVCNRRDDFFLQAAIMVLMISVKNACKLGWFSAKDTDELLTLADEVASFFVTKKDTNAEVCNFLPTVSTVISRFYPRFKLGQVIASLEVEPGYGTHLVDFHITKDTIISKDEKIYLFVAMKDNTETSSCIISPQKVNVLLNGNGVDHRNTVSMDHGPQLPTMVNRSLKYGINLLQVVGQFNGRYVFVIALMSVTPSSGLPFPLDYDQPVSAALSSDSEIIEGPSRVSLNCPISKTRITTPVKGNFCKHYQCFDLCNYVEMNSKRPNWRCPSCNRPVCFTDLRVDQKMAKALKEVGENVSEVIISADGSWTSVSSDKHKDESHDKTSANQEEGHELEESSTIFSALDNLYDLTGDDDEMDTCEAVDMKPVVHHNVQGQSVPSNLTPPLISRSTMEPSQFSSAQAALLFNSLSAGFNIRPQAHPGVTLGTFSNSGLTPVLTDAVSPALNRQPDNFQGTNYPTSSRYAQITVPGPTSLQLQDAVYSQTMMNNMHLIPRNVTRVSSAIQALPVPMPTTNMQQHSRPTVSIPAANASSVLSQGSPVRSNMHSASSYGSNVERQWHLPVSPLNMSNMASIPPQNRSASPGVRLSTTNHNMYTPQAPQQLSQPPHLMRTSQLPRNHSIQHGVTPRVGASNSPSTLQRVQLPQASQVRHSQTMPLQTQAVRMPSSSPLNMGTPQAVSRSENLIDLQLDHNWRPTGRMRGALTGDAYSKALNQYMGQAAQPAQAPSPSPSPRPSVSSASPMLPNIQVLLANRRVASEMHDRQGTGASTVSGTPGTRAEGPPGVN